MSKKIKYYYNPSSLKYEKVKEAKARKWLLGIAFVACSVIFGILSLYITSSLWESPKEKFLEKELNKVQLQYEVLQEKAKKMDVVINYLKDRDEHIYRVIFEAEPISDDIRMAGTGGIDNSSGIKGYYNSTLFKKTNVMLDQVARKIYIQSKSFDELQRLMTSRIQMLSSIPGIQPVDSRRIKGIISGFGYRIHPIYKIVKMHTGLDFTAPIGTPIYATGDGVVTLAGNDSGYGRCVHINHGYGYRSLYAHMSRIKSRMGQRVNRGDVIGYVGSSGTSTGPHLHYEVIKGKDKVNPINFFYNDLSPLEYQAMLEASSKSNQSFD